MQYILHEVANFVDAPMKRRKRESFTLKEDISKYLLDLSKLVFAGIVLGTVLRYEVPRDILHT